MPSWLSSRIMAQPPRIAFGRGGGLGSAGSSPTQSLPPPPNPLLATDFAARTALEAADVDPTLQAVTLQGYDTPGDGGAARYVRTGSQPGHEGRIRSADGGWWEILPDPSGLRPQQFGAVGDGSTDDAPALQACLQAAVYLNANGNAHSLVGAERVSFSKIRVDLGFGRAYRLGAPITLVNPRLEIVGQNITLTHTDFDDFLFICSGSVTNLTFRGFTMEATRQGCIRIDGLNIAGARVECLEMVFATDPNGHETGVAVDYTNRSSSIAFKRCFFNRVKHPLHVRNCDFISFEDCWFGFAKNAIYADHDGYIRIDKGFCRINDCLFAGGPAGVVTGGRQTNGSEIAYVNVGIAGSEAPDEDHARVSITNTRIAYEAGAGALVNYFVEPVSGSDFRSGIVLDNVQAFPREEKEPTISGGTAAGLIRLFEMPHQIVIDGLHGNAGNIGVIMAGSTTSLSALRAHAPQAVEATLDPADTRTPSAEMSFSINNLTAVNAYAVLTGDRTEYNHWLELFGCFDYFFASDAPSANSAGNTPLASIVTWFSNFTEQRGAIFEVHGGAFARVSSGSQIEHVLDGRVHVMMDEASNAVHATYHDMVDASVLPTRVKVEAKFLVGGARLATVNLAQAASAVLVLEVSHATNPTVNIRCQGLVVRPVSASLASRKGAALIQG